MSWIILVLEHRCLNELKLEAVQRKMLRQGNMEKKCIKDTCRERQIKFTSAILTSVIAALALAERPIFLNHRL